MIELNKTLQPARDALGTSGVIMSPGQIRDSLDAIVTTLDTLIQALEAFAASQSRPVVQVPMDKPLLPPEPGLTPNPNSAPPTELNIKFPSPDFIQNPQPPETTNPQADPNNPLLNPLLAPTFFPPTT